MLDYDQTVCKCRCHDGLEVKHVVACCSQCPFCDKRIQLGRSNEHMRLCSSGDEP